MKQIWSKDSVHGIAPTDKCVPAPEDELVHKELFENGQVFTFFSDWPPEGRYTQRFDTSILIL